jgi:hypothetical protein
VSTAPSTTSAHRGVPRWPPPTSAAARGATACQCVIYTQASAHTRFRPRAHRRTHVVESLLLWLAPLTQQRRRWCVRAAVCARPPCCVCAVGAATLGGRVQWGHVVGARQRLQDRLRSRRHRHALVRGGVCRGRARGIPHVRGWRVPCHGEPASCVRPSVRRLPATLGCRGGFCLRRAAPCVALRARACVAAAHRCRHPAPLQAASRPAGTAGAAGAAGVGPLLAPPAPTPSCRVCRAAYGP